MAEPLSDDAALGSPGPSLGLLETHGLVAALEGADAMLKASEVRLYQQERTVPGLITCLVVGETAAVQSAVDAGRAAAERIGRVLSAHVIPRPAPETWRMLTGKDYEPRTAVARTNRPADDLAALTVPELRRRARAVDDPSFSGRTISRATKDELLHFLRT